MNENVTPVSVFRSFWLWFPVGVLVMFVIATLVYLVSQGSWWWQNENANRQNQIIQNGNSYQETLRSEITAKIGDVQRMSVQISNPAYKAEKANLEQSRYYAASLVCGDAAQISGVPLRPAQDQWVRTNCLNGNVKPTSIYNVSQEAGS